MQRLLYGIWFGSHFEIITNLCFADIENGKSYIGKCGHSICAACTNQPASSKCPHCNRESAFEVSRGIRQLFQKINESRYPQPFEQLESFGETELSDEIKVETTGFPISKTTFF